MTKENIYLLIGDVFITAYKKYEVSNKPSKIAEKIINDLKFLDSDKREKDKTAISGKTLTNYYNYYILDKGKLQNPNDDNLIILINYSKQQTFTSIKDAINHFEIHKPSREYVDNNIPYKIIEPETNKKNQIVQQSDQLKANSKLHHSSKSYHIVIITIVALVVILCVSGFYFFRSKGNTTINMGGVEINNDFRQIYPTKDTRFFSKDNQPIIWYTSNKNEQPFKFYNQGGTHPITKEILYPITGEVIERYFLEQKNTSKYISPLKTTTPIKLDEPISTNSESKKLSPKAKKNNTMSVYFFDSVDKMDIDFSNHIKKEFKNQYTIHYSKLPKIDKEKITSLKNRGIRFLKELNKNSSQYICIGNTKYSFLPNPILQGKITCKMYIEYSIISTITGEIIDSYSNTIAGYGSTELSAKNTTINKFSL